jgi:hypothetical protein
LVADIEGGTKADGVEENIWALEGRGYRRVEKIA